MIDIHCHILPGIDDGPSDINESIQMARMAFDDGIRAIVATPHINESLYPPAVIQHAVDELSSRLAELSLPLSILRGADVSALIDPLFLADYTIAGTDYILIEFPHSHLPKNAGEIIFNVTVKGFQPIITHPERNPSVINNPDQFLSITGDALIQITADSLTGLFGLEVRECALYFLKRGVVSFIASDAHSLRRRRPTLSAGLKVAEQVIGKEAALRLVKENPQAVISGNRIHVS